ncbi:MAG TPA: prenyltransferase/squalene oxidase repeat-containing protein [Vicinamibacterales bacterium]|nr:prenyltransferase/squalene oxidase repeat-containing protein [Vicinamibacterales bacterium]
MRLLAASLLFAVISPGVVVWSSAQASRAPTTDWNREAAAEYLDRRMDDWFANAEQLRTGEGRTACVSCHTVIPYVLARPRLRSGMGIVSPTPQELRLAEDTSQRVRTFDSHQLLYDFDESKRAESQGTEAVLYALILAAMDGNRASAHDDATRRAMERLWATQRDDGGWEWLDVGLEPFESAGSAYQGAAFAALAVGLAPMVARATDSTHGIDRLRKYLSEKFSTESLHNRLWGVLASVSLENVLSRADRDALVPELQRLQNGDGGWSLDRLGGWQWNRRQPPFQPPGTRDPSITSLSDGYATGLIVYALVTAGIRADHPIVAPGVRWLAANQRPVRVGKEELPAWRAHSLNYDREHGGARGEPWRRLFMSDAATAFAALALVAVE